LKRFCTYILTAMIFLSCVSSAWGTSSIEISESAFPHPSAGEYSTFLPEGDVRRFAGETLYYKISFLWFENAASAKLSFYEKNGTYYSVLEAETKGFVGFFTAYRKHIYKASFEIVDGGKRVRSNRFERQVILGNQVESSTHYMDYKNRKHYWFSEGGSGPKNSGIEDIPPGIEYHGILAGFYNFRNGVYGKIQKGQEYTIHTIPEKGQGEILVLIKNDREQELIRTQQGRSQKDELLVDILVPPELFKTKEGRLRVWGSKHYLPTETTVEDYALLGALHATLIKREKRE